MMLKLGRRARGHFVTLIEIRLHLIKAISGHGVQYGSCYGNTAIE